MTKELEIRTWLQDRYGMLLFDLTQEDRGWHTFRIIWSDDGGTTKISDLYSLRDFRDKLAGLSANTLKEKFEEIRQGDDDLD